MPMRVGAFEGLEASGRVMDVSEMTINGLRIVANHNMVEDGEPIIVHRTWRERLFSRPWRPWMATRTVVPTRPKREFLRIGHSTLMAHPALIEELRRATSGDRGMR